MLQAAVAAIGTAAIAATSPAQAPSRYRASGDTFHYETSTPFTLFWVDGADTVGVVRRDRGIEAHHWSGTDAAPVLTIRRLVLDATRQASVDTVQVTPLGRVVRRGVSPGSSLRIDLLLRLPDAPLAADTRWVDTVHVDGTDDRGPQSYLATRTYRVTRMIDTLGRQVAEVHAEGEVHMRLTFRADSLGRGGWVQAAGPITERFLFDTERSALLWRDWTMSLVGRGVSPGATDTVPASLRSERVLRMAEDEHARFLLASLPHGDTSVTVVADGGAPVVVQTMAREPGRVAVGLTRNDGTVATASITSDGAGPRTYEATWSHPEAGFIRQQVEHVGDSLRLRTNPAADTTIAIPAANWAIADRAMPALLAPQLLALPRDGTPHRFAIFRPSSARWDHCTVTAQLGAGAVVVGISYEGEPDADVVLLTPEGEYLYAELGGPVPTRLLPLAKVQRAHLKAVLAQLNGG